MRPGCGRPACGAARIRAPELGASSATTTYENRLGLDIMLRWGWSHGRGEAVERTRTRYILPNEMNSCALGSVKVRTGGDSPRPGRIQRPADQVELLDRR